MGSLGRGVSRPPFCISEASRRLGRPSLLAAASPPAQATASPQAPASRRLSHRFSRLDEAPDRLQIFGLHGLFGGTPFRGLGDPSVGKAFEAFRQLNHELLPSPAVALNAGDELISIPVELSQRRAAGVRIGRSRFFSLCDPREQKQGRRRGVCTPLTGKRKRRPNCLRITQKRRLRFRRWIAELAMKPGVPQKAEGCQPSPAIYSFRCQLQKRHSAAAVERL